MAWAGGAVPSSMAPRVEFSMYWTVDCTQPATLDTIELSTSVLSVLNAADKTEVETQLNTLATKINELVALIEEMRPPNDP